MTPKKVDAKKQVKEYSAGQIKTVALNILNYEYNVEAWMQNNVAIRGRKFTGRKGIGDIIGFHRVTGQSVMCEVKKIGDTFKEDQKTLLTKLHNAGGLALWATQEGIKVVVKPFVIENDKNVK